MTSPNPNEQAVRALERERQSLLELLRVAHELLTHAHMLKPEGTFHRLEWLTRAADVFRRLGAEKAVSKPATAERMPPDRRVKERNSAC